MRRIYISGPISGMPDLNRTAFADEAARLRALGYEVLNPHEINPDPTVGWYACMRRDIAELMACDAIALLDGWQLSEGAQLEVGLARTLGIGYLPAFLIKEPPMGEKP